MGAYDELKKSLGTTQPVIAPKSTTAPSTVVSTSTPTSALQALKTNLASAPSVATPPPAPPVRGVLGTLADAYGSYADFTRRAGKNIFAGEAATVASIASGLEWLGWKSAGKGATLFNDMAKYATPPDPTFTDQLFQGVGSVGTFFVPALGVVKGAALIGKVSPALALIFGNSSATALEALSEAGSVYDANKKSGMSESEASSKATNTFWTNAVLVGLTNKFGIFGDAKTILKKAVASVVTEGGQEAAQQIISNINTGRPVMEGVAESGAIGAILGGGMGAGVAVATAMPPLKPPTGASVPTQPAQTPQIDLSRRSIDLQKSLETQANMQNGQPVTPEVPASPTSPQAQIPPVSAPTAPITPQVSITPTAPLVIPQSKQAEVKQKGVKKTTPESLTVVPTEQEGIDRTLREVAKKHKSSETFIAEYGTPVFRGEYKRAQKVNDGISTSLSKEVAESFSETGKASELFIPKDARVVDITTLRKKILGVSKLPNPSTLTKAQFEAITGQRLVNFAKKQGYDVIDHTKSGIKSSGVKTGKVQDEQEMQVVNPKILKSRKELEEVWDRATVMGLAGKTLTVEKGAFDNVPRTTMAEVNLAVENIRKNLKAQKEKVSEKKEPAKKVAPRPRGAKPSSTLPEKLDNAPEPISSVAYRGTKTMEELMESLDTDYGEGFYFALKKETAQSYGEAVQQYQVELKNPLVLNTRYEMNDVWDTMIDDQNTGKVEEGITMREYLREKGFDGIHVKEAGLGGDIVGGFLIAFDKTSVKDSTETPKKETPRTLTEEEMSIPEASRFYIWEQKEAKWSPVRGRAVQVMDGISTFVSQSKPSGKYVVSEVTTGSYIAEGDTATLAVNEAKARVEEAGKQKIDELIKKNQHSEPPVAGYFEKKVKSKKTAKTVDLSNMVGNRLIPEDMNTAIEEEAKFILKTQYKNNKSYMEQATTQARDYLRGGTKIGDQWLLTSEVKVSKSDLKSAVDTMPNKEMVLTIEKKGVDTFLTAKNDKGTFRLKASALGLVEENLKVGETITISSADLKAKGSRYRAVNAGGTFASVGEFREGKGQILLHGGVKDLDGGILQTRKGAGGQDAGGIFFSPDTETGRMYAYGYTLKGSFRGGGKIHRVMLDADAKIFDMQNPDHIDAIRNKLGDQSAEDILSTARNGVMDWATGAQYFDVIEELGFDGAKLSERPAGFDMFDPETGRLAKTKEDAISFVLFDNTKFKMLPDEPVSTPETFDSVGEFQDGTPIKLGEYENVKPIQFPELVALSRELMGQYPKVVEAFRAEGKRGDFTPEGEGRIRLVGSLFEKKNLGQLQKTLAHEIGHLIDWLPNKMMTRGNLLGRLNTLSNFRKEFLPNQYRVDSELRDQMYELSKYWRPYNEATASESFVAYRKSAEEVYADFISALFNDPLLVQDMAPSAYNLFFQQLDAKPEVKVAYFELQDLLRNGAEVVARRKEKAKNMFDYGDAVAKERQVQLQAEEDAKQKSIWFKFKFQYVDITERVKELKAQMIKEGRTLNPEDDPTYYLEERNYLGGKIRALVDEKFNGIYQQLQKNDMSWEDLGEMMMYERILLGDRGEVANPEGLQPEFVQELYGDIGTVKSDATAETVGQSSMQTLLGNEKFNKLKELAKQFRSNLKEVFEEGYNEGLYSENLHKMMQANDFYVPFRPIKYSAEKSRFGVMKQVGSLQQIENPANTAIEKAVAITRAIERNKVAKKTVNFLQKEFSSEVEDAKLAFNGKVQIPQEPKKGSGQGLVTYHEGGKVKGFYVDEYISDAIQRNTTSQNGMMIEALQTMNSTLFRPLFITFNLGFQSFNVVRDFARFWKNIPDMTLLRTLNLYRKSFRAAKIRGFGLPENPSEADLEANALLNKLESEQMISITFNDIIRGEDLEDRQIDRILRETGVRTAEPTKLGLIGEKIGVDRNSLGIKQALGIMDWIESTGNLIETLPKVAGRFALEGKMPPREMRSYIRKYLGSPDFLAGGKFKPVINEVFLFANAIFQGIRADFEIATRPQTRSAYWWKTTQANILPKLLMLAASAGLLGEWLKDVFGKMSEYDKTNYITVPLGIDENGRAIYFRVPQDETGRLLSGLFWKVGNAASNPAKLADLETYTNLLAYAGGQTPSISPAITATYNVSQFVAGDNPYDFFRQRSVLTDDQMAAGGAEKAKPFAFYMFNQLGGGVFMKVYVNETVPKEKTLGERIISLPIASNIAGRFIKITNYGETEKLREVQNEIRSDKAREGLVNRRVVFEYVQKSQGVSYGEKQKIKQDMIREIYDGLPKTKEDRLQARSLERRFELLRLRGSADAQLDALLISQSNDEKVALLKAYQITMTKTEFEELRKFIIRNKVVSSDAYAQFIRESR